MTTQTLTSSATFLRHLTDEAAPLILRRGAKQAAWADQPLHDDLWQQDPELYALSALAENAQPGQQSRALLQLLRQGRSVLAVEVRQTVERVVAVLLDRLPVGQVLTVFLALRRERANHKHIQRTVLSFLLNHPDLERLARDRRPTLVDVLEHVLGKNTARGIARRLGEPEAEPRLTRPLLRWAKDPERARAVVRYLYHQTPLPQAPSRSAQLQKERGRLKAKPDFTPPKTVTATNRGDVSATLVHLYRGGDSPELRQALGQYVERAAAELPRFAGRLALVLDASASTQGYGEREFCCIAQSQALRLVLQRCVADLRVITVGGTGEQPRPEGATDLATALLDALETQPDLVALVTDGYENVLHGDLARVAAALPAAGCDVPVVFCQSKFTHKDDVTLRQPAPLLPQLEFWHEVDFAPLLRNLFARARGERGRQYLAQYLRARLEKLEKEREACLSIS